MRRQLHCQSPTRTNVTVTTVERVIPTATNVSVLMASKANSAKNSPNIQRQLASMETVHATAIHASQTRHVDRNQAQRKISSANVSPAFTVQTASTSTSAKRLQIFVAKESVSTQPAAFSVTVRLAIQAKNVILTLMSASQYLARTERHASINLMTTSVDVRLDLTARTAIITSTSAPPTLAPLARLASMELPIIRAHAYRE